MQSFTLYTLCLFSMLLNDDVVDIEKLYRICSLTFAVVGFSGVLSHSSIFSSVHATSA